MTELRNRDMKKDYIINYVYYKCAFCGDDIPIVKSSKDRPKTKNGRIWCEKCVNDYKLNRVFKNKF